MGDKLSIHYLDAVVILLYMAMLIGIGWYHSRGQKDLKDFFLAGKSMRWLPVGLSVMAALNSGMDYLMQPSAMVKYGALVLSGPLAWLIMYPWIFYVTLPFYRRLGVYSAYEYLELRFCGRVRTLAAFIFILWRLGLMALAIYVPCFALAVISKTEHLLPWFIAVLGTVVMFYTMLGGLKGVIWVDVAQFCVMFGGLLLTFFVVLWNVPNLGGELWKNISLVGIDLTGLPGIPWERGFLSGLKEYFLVPMSFTGLWIFTTIGRMTIYTSDQVMVQRFQTTRTIRDARQSVIITVISDLVWLVFLSLLGVALFAFYTRETGTLPPELVANTDRIFPMFMAQVFPVGVTGLVIAAILAASLSSYDGALNSLTTVCMVDFVNRFFCKGALDIQNPTPEQTRQQVRLSRICTIGIGILGILLAINVNRLGTLIEMAMKLLGGFSGPILAIYLLGMFTRRVNATGVFWGTVVGALLSVYGIVWSSPDLIASIGSHLPFFKQLFPAGRPLSGLWPGILGLAGSLVFSWLFSLLTPAEPEKARWRWRAVVAQALVE